MSSSDSDVTVYAVYPSCPSHNGVSGRVSAPIKRKVALSTVFVSVPMFSRVFVVFVALVCLHRVHGEFFIRIVDGEFVDGCDRFLLTGWNQWEVIESAAGAPDLIGSIYPPGEGGPKVRSPTQIPRYCELAVE